MINKSIKVECEPFELAGKTYKTFIFKEPNWDQIIDAMSIVESFDKPVEILKFVKKLAADCSGEAPSVIGRLDVTAMGQVTAFYIGFLPQILGPKTSKK